MESLETKLKKKERKLGQSDLPSRMVQENGIVFFKWGQDYSSRRPILPLVWGLLLGIYSRDLANNRSDYPSDPMGWVGFYLTLPY